MPSLNRRRLIALAFFAPLAACTLKSPEYEPSDLASGQTGMLSVYRFQALTEAPGTVIIDVRTPEEYAQGHIDRAINLDLSASTFDSEIDQLDRDANYALYCRSGQRSQEALDKMVAAGFGSVAHLEGGIQAWTDAGLPLVS